ncbi:MAG TPA: hypothetical protein VJK54_01125, partial [Chthoniobacterales bacterium]|nr:hypothetical protein [Chthoniobacterales bacterium]
AADYRKVIATYQRAADQFKQAGEDYIADKEEEDTNSWLLRGMCLQKKAEYQAKAIEARDAGKETLDRGYRQAVGLSERAADQLELKARRQLGIRWGLQGLFLQARASCFVRELEEQEATGMMTESGPLLAPPPISVTKNKAMRELEKKL